MGRLRSRKAALSRGAALSRMSVCDATSAGRRRAVPWPPLDGRGAASEKIKLAKTAPLSRAFMASVILIDNYDSFTFNLAHYLGALGAQVSVWRNDEISVAEVLAARPDAIVLSPG